MIPALLFFFSGTQIISSSLWSVLMRYNYGLEETLEEDSSFFTILVNFWNYAIFYLSIKALPCQHWHWKFRCIEKYKWFFELAWDSSKFFPLEKNKSSSEKKRSIIRSYSLWKCYHIYFNYYPNICNRCKWSINSLKFWIVAKLFFPAVPFSDFGSIIIGVIQW